VFQNYAQDSLLFLYDLAPDHWRWPSILNWNLAVQQEIAREITLQVTYAGTSGYHLTTGADDNQPYPSANPNSTPQSRRPFPNLGTFGAVHTYGTSNYNALQFFITEDRDNMESSRHNTEGDEMRASVLNNRLLGIAYVLICLAGTLTARAADSRQVMYTAVPTEIDGPVNNPYMGWGIWAGPRYFDGRSFTLKYNTAGFGDDAPLYSWVLIDWMWSDLEPQEGQYYWKDLETIIHYWAERGKQIELRIWITDDPGWAGAPGNEVCPKWLWKDGVRYHAYTGEGKTHKREPDYADPSYQTIYLPKARRFLVALADRYDTPQSPVVLWGLFGYGQWGEWHTLWSNYPWPNKDVKNKILTQLVNMYQDIFKVKKLSISYCIDHDNSEVTSLKDFLYRQALDAAIPHEDALARHAFIDGFDYWDTLVMKKYWTTNPMWAEGNWAYTAVKDQGTHGTFDENIDVMLEWHSNWGHFYTDAESYKRSMKEDRASLERGLERGGLGFRLVPTEVSWPLELAAGDLFLMRQIWVNRNVGRLYERHPLKVYLTDSQGKEKFSEVDRSFDETHWVRGETYPVTSIFHLKKDLPPGAYEVRVALVDYAGKPQINLAIQGQDSEKRYKLGTIRILPARSQAACDSASCR
jgi:hypothetical protein